MKVFSSFARTLIEGIGEENCTRMELVQETVHCERPIRGSGYLRGGPDGKIRFKIFVSDLENAPDPEELRNNGVAGLIIPPNQYFSLSLADRYGGIWTSRRILPTRSELVIEGDLSEIRSTCNFHGGGSGDALDQAALEGGGITLWFQGKIDLPFNAATLTSTKVKTFGVTHKRLEDDYDLPSFSRNVVRFNSSGCDFDITQDDGHYRLTIRSPSRFPSHVTTRVMEALQFILGKAVSWRISETHSGGRSETLVRWIGGNPERSNFLPPLRCWQVKDLNGEWTYRLFDRYLRFLLRRDEDGWNPCSVYLYNAIAASTNSADAYALALGVATEGLCNSLYPELCQPSEDEASLLRDLIEHLGRWPDPVVEERLEERKVIANRLRARAKGSLEGLSRVRVEDRMKKLVELGAIEQRHVQAWKKLRNSLAHAELPDPKEAQKHATRRFSVCVLMYQLIFFKIGYEGYYNDYSRPNFPIAYYRPGHADDSSPPQED